MRVLIYILVLVSAGPEAFALNLDQATHEAEANSPDLRRLQAVSERLSWGKLDAASTYLPHLTAGFDHYFKSEYMRENVVFGGAVIGFPAAYPQDSLNLEAEITVFDGFAGMDRFRAARLNAEAAELDLRRARLNLSANVRNAFCQALAAQKLVEVAKQNVNTLEEHLAHARLTERSGYGVRFDVLRIEATLEEARAELESAENNVFIARDGLTVLLGQSTHDDRPLEGELPVLKEADIPKDLSLDPAARSDMQAQFLREQASAQEVSAAHGAYLPSLSVFADEQYYKFGSFDPAIEPTPGYQNAWAFGLRLRWNIFDGGHTYARAQMASAAAGEAAAQTQKEMTRLPREFDTWKRKYFYSVSLYRARVRALKQFEESVRLAGVSLRAGTRTHTEMLDAELDLFRARGGVVRAQAEAIEALGNLELAAGRVLWAVPN
jgi:outer membrane protein TolC